MSQAKKSLPGITNFEPCEQAIKPADASSNLSNSIELRIIQDGTVYRSKAEMERLVALGHWHHRRQRRKDRFRR
ncbi:MAG: hypothetical protein GY732_05835 [Gammaproteobacteria bacterium]|nr:hypothetical protein [Gammaproteobacteria bacterium]